MIHPNYRVRDASEGCTPCPHLEKEKANEKEKEPKTSSPQIACSTARSVPKILQYITSLMPRAHRCARETRPAGYYSCIIFPPTRDRRLTSAAHNTDTLPIGLQTTAPGCANSGGSVPRYVYNMPPMPREMAAWHGTQSRRLSRVDGLGSRVRSAEGISARVDACNKELGLRFCNASRPFGDILILDDLNTNIRTRDRRKALFWSCG